MLAAQKAVVESAGWVSAVAELAPGAALGQEESGWAEPAPAREGQAARALAPAAPARAVVGLGGRAAAVLLAPVTALELPGEPAVPPEHHSVPALT